MPVGKTSKADTMTKSLSLLLNKVRPSQLRKILKLNFRLNENLRTLIIFTEMCAELASEHFKSGLRSRSWILAQTSAGTGGFQLLVLKAGS